MARAIDSEVAFRFLTEQLVKETGAFSKGVNKGLNIARSAMRNPDAIPTLTPPNEPLTLEQLREMDGEPVWVKQLKGLSVCDTGWAVVEFRLAPDVKHDKIRVWWPGSEDEDTPSEDDYGKTWLAYRRPPEGEGEPNGYERAEEKHENKG